ncbi:helix-turn-helix transcriptional regulator [Clostridium sp. KNHs216]|uniref:helix-turn-helix transcriptional regulator n=1 Tax=Clostridium sp. KNHs216 TaxID=1550235 RepID=UPI00114E9173|nr:helix-turn-helix transcriptional regulator [Clostridium sp. KNHs216]TQI69033.1 helix-turn-helix protein [Clostridium sp. KNHs216]
MNNKTGASKRKKDIVLGRIKDLREWEKLTQAEFAESIEVSPNTISRIEREEMSLSSDIH